MHTGRAIPVLAAAVALFAGAGLVEARPHHTVVAGIVATRTGTSFTVDRPRGADITVTTSKSTQFRKQGGAAATIEDVKQGVRVVVMGTRSTGGAVAATRVSLIHPRGQR